MTSKSKQKRNLANGRPVLAGESKFVPRERPKGDRAARHSCRVVVVCFRCCVTLYRVSASVSCAAHAFYVSPSPAANSGELPRLDQWPRASLRGRGASDQDAPHIPRRGGAA